MQRNRDVVEARVEAKAWRGWRPECDVGSRAGQACGGEADVKEMPRSEKFFT